MPREPGMGRDDLPPDRLGRGPCRDVAQEEEPAAVGPGKAVLDQDVEKGIEQALEPGYDADPAPERVAIVLGAGLKLDARLRQQAQHRRRAQRVELLVQPGVAPYGAYLERAAKSGVDGIEALGLRAQFVSCFTSLHQGRPPGARRETGAWPKHDAGARVREGLGRGEPDSGTAVGDQPRGRGGVQESPRVAPCAAPDPRPCA